MYMVSLNHGFLQNLRWMAEGRQTGWTPIANVPSSFLGALAALILGWFLHLASRRNTPLRLPPGPPGIPILGHLHILEQGSKRFKQFQGWHDKYGPLVSLKLGSSNLFLLGGDGHRSARTIGQTRSRILATTQKKDCHGSGRL
ncbi:hypothetical protein BS47DRAFT_1129982 [Hydnum rufescens UP504]|uniref:Cytochrome P450 n=1 Tax=Hydnum rufescens UP504 TaxID=1448309 RepID=A0A9P6DUU2_9AGAM|nr:hypothetical protein BS47DRAFT_1129982 [Hydnum rufescens UP504]